MENIVNILKILAIIIASLIIIFLILLALPNSKLRSSILKIYAIVSFIIAITSAGYVISPLDALPDFIPVAGQTDDLAAAISSLASAITGYISWQKSKERAESR